MLFKKKKGKGYGEILFNKTVKYTSLVRILQEKQQSIALFAQHTSSSWLSESPASTRSFLGSKDEFPERP